MLLKAVAGGRHQRSVAVALVVMLAAAILAGCGSPTRGGSPQLARGTKHEPACAISSGDRGPHAELEAVARVATEFSRALVNRDYAAARGFLVPRLRARLEGRRLLRALGELQPPLSGYQCGLAWSGPNGVIIVGHPAHAEVSVQFGEHHGAVGVLAYLVVVETGHGWRIARLGSVHFRSQAS